jgi:protease-4
MREDGWSSYGTESKTKFLKAIYDIPNIKGVVLDINSGGGEVDGTMTFANAIKNRNKPVVALVNSIAASAAYWIAQNSDTILMNDSTAQVGSIGVMMTFIDDQKYWEDMGIKWVDIIADKSQDKNKGYFDALKGKYQTIKNESLNPLREMFAQAVIDARGTKIDLEAENVLSGKMYFASATPSGNKSAIDVGLADGIGDMEAAINQVLKLAETAKYVRQTSNNF